MKDPISVAIKMFYDLTTDHENGRFLGTKIGEVVVGMTWTYYMLVTLPGDWEMWLAYAGTVMGWSSARYYLKNKTKAAQPQADPPDPDAGKKE